MQTALRAASHNRYYVNFRSVCLQRDMYNSCTLSRKAQPVVVSVTVQAHNHSMDLMLNVPTIPARARPASTPAAHPEYITTPLAAVMREHFEYLLALQHAAACDCEDCDRLLNLASLLLEPWGC